MNKLHERMMTDVYYTLGQMPSKAIDPKYEYVVAQRLKDLWRKSRKRAMSQKAKTRR